MRTPVSAISRISRSMRWRAAGIEAVGRLVEEQHLGAVHDRLRQLGELLHAQRVGLELAVARFAEADVEQAPRACARAPPWAAGPASSAIMRTKRTAVRSAMIGVALGHVAEAALERDAVGA